MVTQTIIEGNRLTFLPGFTLPTGGREYPYGMPTALMVGLHTNASTYANNAMVVASSVNQHMASRSSRNNLGRMGQTQEGLRHIP